MNVRGGDTRLPWGPICFGPVCLEWFSDRKGDGLCGKIATHEVRMKDFDDTFGAKCARCIRFYNPKSCIVRELTDDRSRAHELAQWRAGTLPRSSK